MKTRRLAGARDVVEELAQVLAVLQDGEDAAELLGRRELRLGHHVEEAVAEELLDRGAVELAEDPQRALAGAPDEGEDGVVGRGLLEPAEALRKVGRGEARCSSG